MTATSNIIDQEKMAVILQEVVGKEVDGYYFPSFSGVGRSLNYYPLNDEKPEDGVAEIAVGLGKYIVDGGLSLRFSRATPTTCSRLPNSHSPCATHRHACMPST